MNRRTTTMPEAYLREEICAKARDKMVELLEATEDKGSVVQHRAADALLRACQTQERSSQHPQTPAHNSRGLEQTRSALGVGSGPLLIRAKTVRAGIAPGP
jgi:hypothetical protein